MGFRPFEKGNRVGQEEGGSGRARGEEERGGRRRRGEGGVGYRGG